MPIDPAVKQVMAKINRKNGPGTVILGSEIFQPARQTITSGSLSFDVALGGGWATNHWIEIVGNECLAPGTKILCADLVWRPIEDLFVGQEIVGFGEQQSGFGRGVTSHYEKAFVTSLGRKTLPVYEIETRFGVTKASAGHLWLHTNTNGHKRKWIRTDQLKVGDRLAAFGGPWTKNVSWEAGWLAGFYDGEGSLEYAGVLAVHYLGEEEVVTIGTSSKTLIADGLLSHNSVGKTLVVLKTIAANQRLDPNWTTVWFATEDFVDYYAEMLGCDLSRIIVENENTMEAVYEHTIDFIDTKAIDCVVIDSLPGLVPAREEDATMEDFQPGLAAFLTGKFFRKANPSMKRSLHEEERPVTGFVINQWREKIGVMHGDPRTTPGGKAKNFFFHQRVELRRKEFIKNTKNEPVGQTVVLTNIKNKYARPGRVGEVDAYIADWRGFKAGSYDVTKDVVSAAIAYGVVERTGGERSKTYVFGDTSWTGGQPAVFAAVKSDAKLRARIKKAVLAAAASPLPPSTQPKRVKAQ